MVVSRSCGPPVGYVRQRLGSIGYDEPHGNVEAALKRAAEECDPTEVVVSVEELMDKPSGTACRGCSKIRPNW